MLNVQLISPADAPLKGAYMPGQQISAQVTWNTPELKNKSLEARLIWFTSGKGNRDFSTIDIKTIPVNSDIDSATVVFEAPSRPSSFSSKYITLTWAIEVVAIQSALSDRVEFMISPDGQEIKLTPVPQDSRGTRPWIAIGK